MFLLVFIAFFIILHLLIKQQYNRKKDLKSLPIYYSYSALTWFAIIAFSLIVILFASGKNSYSNLYITLIATVTCCYLFYRKFVTEKFNARTHFEKQFIYIIKALSLISITITIAIVLSIIFEAFEFFKQVNIFDFLFGTEWNPQIAIRKDQAGGSGSFGAIPVFLGTFLITIIAMLVAVPLGLASAIYLTEYSSSTFRKYAKPALEILAGIPTVVYGYFAAFAVAPLVKKIGLMIGLNVASESALAAGIVMGIMIIPFVLSLSDDVMNAVPESLRQASIGLGSTQSEMIKKVIIPAALPGIIGAFLLAISRAIGETMIVVMAAGLRANMTINPLDSVTTATAQIVTLLVGDQEFDSVKTLSAFALGLTLFVVTLTLNVIALMVVKKYRERYE